MTLRLARLTAWVLCAMIRYDLTNRVFGFPYIQRRLTQQRTANRKTPLGVTVLLCEAVNLAACFYFKPVRCLQKSVVTFQLLRKWGIEAHLVIGYRASPFVSHAWVEVAGQVVNDSPAYQEQLKLLWTI